MNLTKLVVVSRCQYCILIDEPRDGRNIRIIFLLTEVQIISKINISQVDQQMSEDGSLSFSQQLQPDWVCMDFEKIGNSFYSNEGVPLNDSIRTLKKKAILEAYNRSDYKTLVEYARSTEGLIDNAIRIKLWIFFLEHNNKIDYNTRECSDSIGCSREISRMEKLSDSALGLDLISASDCYLNEFGTNDLPPHKDEEQVKLDINRSFTFLSMAQQIPSPHSESYTNIISKGELEFLRKTLLHLIVSVLRKYPCLNYYQGYHDIAGMVLLVCWQSSPSFTEMEETAFKILENLTLFHVRDFMITDINLAVNHLRLIPALLERCDEDLFSLIKRASYSYISSGGERYDYDFYQSLSSIITLFSHDMKSPHHLLIIWDFGFSFGSVLIFVYIFAASLILKRNEIFEALNLDPEVPFEMTAEIDCDLVHKLVSPEFLLQGLTDEGLIKLLRKARILVKEHPMNELDNSSDTFKQWFETFNKNSAILTTSCLFSHKEHNQIIDNLMSSSSYEIFYENLNTLMQVQDEEISKQNVFYESQTRGTDTMDNSTIDYDTSLANSLSSSISSLYSSRISKRITDTSSSLIRRLFLKLTLTNSNTDDKENLTIVFTKFYKLSLTVGIIGLMLHFILKNTFNLQDHLISKFAVSFFKSFKSLISNQIYMQSVKPLAHDLVSLICSGSKAIGIQFVQVSERLRDMNMLNHGVKMGEVGLGNLRNDLYNLN